MHGGAISRLSNFVLAKQTNVHTLTVEKEERESGGGPSAPSADEVASATVRPVTQHFLFDSCTHGDSS